MKKPIMKPSDELEIGDIVKLRNEETGKWNNYEVTSKMRNITNPYFSHWCQYDSKMENGDYFELMYIIGDQIKVFKKEN